VQAAQVASFADFATAEPEVAARVQAALDAHRHKVLATLRSDGSPRVSGIEASVVDGELWLAGMPRSAKFADLRRDPRMALHSGSDEPGAFTADGKVSGRAVEVTDPATRQAFAAAAGGRAGRAEQERTEATEQAAGAGQDAEQDFDLFRVELEQAVLVAVDQARQVLVISSWRPGRGLRRVERS
jgi:Pyridoxamine 5'-phosphate oxidase